MTLGLALTALAFGLRHGVDWDHIAAIADLTGSAENRRRGFVLSMLYATGHALVVGVLGVVLILVGATIPPSAESIASRIAGVTLVALGLWIIVELARKRRNFRLRSRWMLILEGTFAGLRRVRHGRRRLVFVDHEHAHDHLGNDHAAPAAHDHAHIEERAASEAVAAGSAPRRRRTSIRTRHRHQHRHQMMLSDQPSTATGNGTAAGIGVIHGIGIESPTQIAVFVASTSVVGTGGGLLLLVSWVIGLLVANAGLAGLAGLGLLSVEGNFVIYASLAVAVGLASIVLGALLLLG